MKKGLPFALDVFLESSADSYLCFQLALHHSMSYIFFLYESPCLSLCTIFDTILSNMVEVLSINPSAKEFVLGDFNAHHEAWLTYFGETDRLVTDPVSNDLTHLVKFPTRITDYDSCSPALLVCFFFLTLVFVLQWPSLHWEILIMLLHQFPLTLS